MQGAVSFSDGRVIIRAPKCLLVLTLDEYRRALQRGKRFRRAQAAQARMQKAGSRVKGSICAEEGSGLTGRGAGPYGNNRQ